MSNFPIFRKITNMHIQQLFGVNKNQAARILKKIRERYGKTAADSVRLIELCEHEKLDIGDVCAFLWNQKLG